jgi:hypothetical protein
VAGEDEAGDAPTGGAAVDRVADEVADGEAGDDRRRDNHADSAG